MTKFRLSWARQCGERKAKALGFESFPINPFEIASNEGILVMPKAPDQIGVSGGIIFGDDVGIFYATNIKSEGFQRFTVAHELGHYFLEGHPDEIMKHAAIHISRAGFTEGSNSIEIEADHFASGLLLPTNLVRKKLDNERVGLEGIDALAEASRCSLTASAIRAAECSPYPIAIVVSRNEFVSYSFMSDSFKRLGTLSFLGKGHQLPDTETRQFNLVEANVSDGLRTCNTSSLNDWFGGHNGIRLDEQVVGLGQYGFTLTVLTSEQLPEMLDEDDDEEARLIDSWTPKFAYGR